MICDELVVQLNNKEKSVKSILGLFQILVVKNIDEMMKDDSIKKLPYMYSEDIESVVYEGELQCFCILSTAKISFH
jgi:hypothetical protein